MKMVTLLTLEDGKDPEHPILILININICFFIDIDLDLLIIDFSIEIWWSKILIFLCEILIRILIFLFKKY